MSLRFLSLLVLIAAALSADPLKTLRVCADPNNMPFSNEAGQGVENQLAQLLGAKLDASVSYTWWSQRKSFVKNSLDAHKCDVLMGVPSTLDSVSVTRPYYRSTYVFVTRSDRGLRIASLNDERLRHLRIGINVVGDDYAPPAFALASRGITEKITPFSLFGEYREPDPARKIIDAVDRGAIDVAIVWGPVAGYYAKLAHAPLSIEPVTPAAFEGIPFTFDISIGVRKGDAALQKTLDGLLEAQAADVGQILTKFGVPQVR